MITLNGSGVETMPGLRRNEGNGSKLKYEGIFLMPKKTMKFVQKCLQITELDPKFYRILKLAYGLLIENLR